MLFKLHLQTVWESASIIYNMESGSEWSCLLTRDENISAEYCRCKDKGVKLPEEHDCRKKIKSPSKIHREKVFRPEKPGESLSFLWSTVAPWVTCRDFLYERRLGRTCSYMLPCELGMKFMKGSAAPLENVQFIIHYLKKGWKPLM